MCTSLAYSWREEAQAPLTAPLEGAQRVSTLGHPWHRNTCESARVAVQCGRVEWLKSYFFAFVSMRTSLACVWKDEACAPWSAPPEALVSKSVIYSYCGLSICQQIYLLHE